jgi:hypothetical protein
MDLYGAGAIALGVIGSVWSDLATNGQRAQGNGPHGGALASIAAVYELSQASRFYAAESLVPGMLG